MPFFDRLQLDIRPLHERKNDLRIVEIAYRLDQPASELSVSTQAQVQRIADRMRTAISSGRPVIMTYGAHLIKNGLGTLVTAFLERGWISHIATNGAGSIHDWEFAYQGESSEDVRTNTSLGRFGTWDETGRFINLAVAVGGAVGLGYGTSVSAMIQNEQLEIPSVGELRSRIGALVASGEQGEEIAALCDLLQLIETFNLPAGVMHIPHPYKAYSVQASCNRLGIPFTVHPGVGYDIIYTHPMNSGGAIGRGAVSDFLTFTDSISRLDGGVYLSVGSAIMSPMIFEKALSMSNNLSLQRHGRPIENHFIVVNDIQDGGDWDWRQGEPPKTHPAYYLRFCKSFNRMGGELEYACLDNRAFLSALYHCLDTSM